MTSKKTAELDAPAPVYEEDQTLQPTEEKIVKAETKGSRWVTNLVTKKNGVVVSDEFFHNSTYRGKRLPSSGINPELSFRPLIRLLLPLKPLE